MIDCSWLFIVKKTSCGRFHSNWFPARRKTAPSTRGGQRAKSARQQRRGERCWRSIRWEACWAYLPHKQKSLYYSLSFSVCVSFSFSRYFTHKQPAVLKKSWRLIRSTGQGLLCLFNTHTVFTSLFPLSIFLSTYLSLSSLLLPISLCLSHTHTPTACTLSSFHSLKLYLKYL